MADEDFDISQYIPVIMQAMMTGQIDEMMANAKKVGEIIGEEAYATHQAKNAEEIARQLGPIRDTLNLILQSQGRVDALVDAFTSSEPKGMLGKMLKKMLAEGE